MLPVTYHQDEEESFTETIDQEEVVDAKTMRSSHQC